MLAGQSSAARPEGYQMKNNPLEKAIMALLHLVEGVFTSSDAPNDVRDRVDTPKGIPNDPGRRPPKR
jgi:hypothetical protein